MMTAHFVQDPTPLQKIQHERFTAKLHAYVLFDLSLSLSGNIAISGHDKRSTFIDLYYGKHSDPRYRFKLFYSKEFEKCSDDLAQRRCVSFLENDVSKVVTCTGDRIEIIDTKHDSRVTRSFKVHGETSCLAVREGEIFVAINGSQQMIVLDYDLKIKKNVELKAMKARDCPYDFQVAKDKTFVCTIKHLALADSYDGNVTDYRDTRGRYRCAYSITVSEKLGLIAVLWGDIELGGSRIIVYILNENKSLFVVDVDSAVARIRFSGKDRMMVTGNEKTGEVKMYDLSHLFTYEDLKEHLVSELSKKDCKDLANLCPDSKASISKSISPPLELLRVLERESIIKENDVDTLVDALVEINLSCHTIVDIYQKIRPGYRPKQTYAELKEELKEKEGALDDERKQMRKDLKDLKEQSVAKIQALERKLKIEATESTTKMSAILEELEQTKLDRDRAQEQNRILHSLQKELDWTKTTLEQTKQDRNAVRTELKQCKLDFAKESRALKEVINFTKETISQRDDEASVWSEKDCTSGLQSEEIVGTEASFQAAEFGRLLAGIAEHLTLEDTLWLAMLFSLPPSVGDALRRVSFYETPGMKFLDELKVRKIINMYDVTNLRNAVAFLEMEVIKQNLLDPYQEKISKGLHEQHKAKELVTLEDVNAVKAQRNNTATIQKEDNTKIMQEIDTGEAFEQTETSAQTRDKEMSLEDRRQTFYTERNINKDGGTIYLGGTSLYIPPGALSESCVIGLNVMNEDDYPLPKEVGKARMTPIIKLEPLGLPLKKPITLTIPHSALILEPQNHGVIVFTGQPLTSTKYISDTASWTEEKSLPRQLKENSVTVDINCLSYLSISLVRHGTGPYLHKVRVVPLVGLITSAADDIVVTIGFCSDADSEYKMLLSDYKEKLPLGKYSTLQLRRNSDRSEGDGGFLSMTANSTKTSCVSCAEQTVVTVSHLCTGSRVSHQIRLQKIKDTDSDLVDILLTFSQDPSEPTNIDVKARVKDLIVSREMEQLLTSSSSHDKKTYEDLKTKLSSNLNIEECRKLITHFELTSSDVEMITSNQAPGRMLMKTLEERNVIHPRKVILLFEGLKACHLVEATELTSEYFTKIAKSTRKEVGTDVVEFNQGNPQNASTLRHPKKIRKRTLSDQSVQTNLSSSISSDGHIKTLTKEGHTEHEVVEALSLSKNRVAVARKILQCLGEPDILTKKKSNFIHKEQYIDEIGGEIVLREAHVELIIPPGAVTEGSIVSITMVPSEHLSVPFEERTPQLTPVVKCGQEDIVLIKPVKLRVPHCAVETEGLTSIDARFGICCKAGEIQWRKRNEYEKQPSLKNNHVEVELQNFCTVSLTFDADYMKSSAKKLRVIPLISRLEKPPEDLTVTLWIYNDDEAEHLNLLHEELNMGDKIKLHDFKCFTLKSTDTVKEIHFKSGNNIIMLDPNTSIKKILASALWHRARNKVEFHFKNREGIDDISFKLRLCKRQFLRTFDDAVFDLKIMLLQLLQRPPVPTPTLLKEQDRNPVVEESFQQLLSKLSAELSVVSCLKIAALYGLPADFRKRMKESSDPGSTLFDELSREKLVTADGISSLDSALVRTGNVHIAENVKEYRRRYPTFATNIFTLL